MSHLFPQKEEDTIEILLKTLQSVFKVDDIEQLLGKDYLLKECESILTPPKTSIIRINTMVTDPSVGLAVASKIFSLQDERYKVEALPNLPHILTISSIGPQKVDPFKRQVIVSVECGQSVLRGANVFAAGVLAIEDEEGSLNNDNLVSVWVDVEGRCTRGLKRRYSGKKLFLANGCLKLTREQLFGLDNIKKGIAVDIIEMEWKMPSFDSLPKEMFLSQNLPSILAIEELDIKPGMVVLDMCAAPGGKTSHAAAKMENQGVLIALDKNKKKLEKLERTLENLKVTIAKIHVADSTRLCDCDATIAGGRRKNPPAESPNDYHFGGWGGEGGGGCLRGEESFDRIILDPPCSGLGQRPLILTKNYNFPSTLKEEYSKYQKRLITVASKLLKPGGLLVYSTCTMTPEENEGVVSFSINNLPLKLEAPKFNYGSKALPLYNLNEDQLSNMRRFWPAGPDDTIAFFYACFRKEVK